MQKRVLSGFFIFIVSIGQVLAEDKIQTFVNPSGKIVFTNLLEANEPISVRGTGTLTLLRNEMPASIVPVVETISNYHGVDPNLVSAVMKAESNFNRFAVSP